MRIKPIKPLLLTSMTAAMLGTSPAVAQDQDDQIRDPDGLQRDDPDRDRLRDQDWLYLDLLTPEERDRLLRQLNAAQTEAEQTRILEQHRERMEARVRTLRQLADQNREGGSADAGAGDDGGQGSDGGRGN